MSMVGQLVRVLWYDAWFDLEYGEEEKKRVQYPVETVGFLVADGDVVSVAQDRLPNNDGWQAVTHIPRASVGSVISLTDGSLGVIHNA